MDNNAVSSAELESGVHDDEILLNDSEKDPVTLKWHQTDSKVFLHFMVNNVRRDTIDIEFRVNKVGVSFVLPNGNCYKRTIYLSNDIVRSNCGLTVRADLVEIRLPKTEQGRFWDTLEIIEKPLTSIINAEDADRFVQELSISMNKKNGSSSFPSDSSGSNATESSGHLISTTDIPSPSQEVEETVYFPEISDAMSIQSSTSSSDTSSRPLSSSIATEENSTASSENDIAHADDDTLHLFSNNYSESALPEIDNCMEVLYKANQSKNNDSDLNCSIDHKNLRASEIIVSMVESVLNASKLNKDSSLSVPQERKWKDLLKRYRPKYEHVNDHAEVLYCKEKSSSLSVVPSQLFFSCLPGESPSSKVSARMFAKLWLSEIEYAEKTTASELALVQKTSTELNSIAEEEEEEEEEILNPSENEVIPEELKQNLIRQGVLHEQQRLDHLHRQLTLQWHMIKVLTEHHQDLRKARNEFQLRLIQFKENLKTDQIEIPNELALELLFNETYKIFKDSISKLNLDSQKQQVQLKSTPQDYSTLKHFPHLFERPSSLVHGERYPTPLVKLQFIPKKLFGHLFGCEIVVKCEYLLLGHRENPEYQSYQLLTNLLETYQPEINKENEVFTVLCPESTSIACGTAMTLRTRNYNAPIVILTNNEESASAEDLEYDLNLLQQLRCKVIHCPSSKEDTKKISHLDNWESITKKLKNIHQDAINEQEHETVIKNTFNNVFVSLKELTIQTNGRVDILVTDSETAEILHENIFKSLKDMTGAPCKLVVVQLTSCSNYAGSHSYASKIYKAPPVEDASFTTQLLIHHEDLFCSLEGGSLIYRTLEALKHYNLSNNPNARIAVLFPGTIALSTPNAKELYSYYKNHINSASLWAKPQLSCFNSWWWNFKLNDLPLNSMLLCPATKSIDQVLEILSKSGNNKIAMGIAVEQGEEKEGPKLSIAAVIKKSSIVECYWKTKQEMKQNTMLEEVVPKNVKICMTNSTNESLNFQEIAEALEIYEYLAIVPEHGKFREKIIPDCGSVKVFDYITEKDVMNFKKVIMKEHSERFKIVGALNI